jgi:hypothetical protein
MVGACLKEVKELRPQWNFFYYGSRAKDIVGRLLERWF